MSVSVKSGIALLAGMLVLIGGVAYFLSDKHYQKQQTPSLPVVKVRSVASEPVNDWEEYSGRLEAIERVEIRPRVAGTLLAVHFRDGQLVHKGDLLFTIDPAPFEAELKRARAALAKAQIRQQFTAIELERGRPLVAVGAIADRDFDALEHDAREARAAVEAAQAEVESAELDVGYTRITAPITGRISRPEVTVGNLVKAGGDAVSIASIVSLDPLYAAFNADEQTFLRYFGQLADKGPLQVQVGLAGENGFPHTGKLYSIDNQLDTPSGTIRMRAVVSNPDGRMIPGLQARIRLQASRTYSAVLVDEAAIAIDQDRRYVLIVGKDGKVESRQLALGSRQGQQRVILQGLSSGELVIVEGGQRVRPGDFVQAVQVNPNNEEQTP